VLALRVVDVPAIRGRHLKVAVDGCSSVGGVAVPRLLREMGCDVVRLTARPTGASRELEPLPSTWALGRTVGDARADFGVALDPDADRAAFVMRQARPGRGYTLALAAESCQEREGARGDKPHTSGIIDAVLPTRVWLHRTAVGEARIVNVRAHGAIVGGATARRHHPAALWGATVW
jgi:phosphomannomutase